MGFDRAAGDTVPGAEPLLDQPFDLADLLQQLGLSWSPGETRLSAPLDEATDADLEVARDDALAFSTLFSEFATAVQRAYGDDFAGFGIFTVPREEKEARFVRAAMVTMMLILRRANNGPGIDMIKSTLRERIDEARTYNAIVETFPEYAPYLRSDQQERMETISPEFREKMQRDIGSFIQGRSEVGSSEQI
jgi:hypothetical protein